MKKPKMFIPSSHRLRGAPAVSTAGEEDLLSFFDKYLDSLINHLIFHGLVRQHARRNAGSMQRNTACPV
jgi:hypothetical protein